MFFGRPCRTSPRADPSGRTLAILLLALFYFFAVEPAKGDPKNFVIDNWQTDAGLPNNCVNALLQTKDRYLWIGTSNGLARFDGTRFISYRVADNPRLRSNRIQCLYEGAGGRFWLGTWDGGLIRLTRGETPVFDPVENISSDTIHCLSEDESGALWIGSASGLKHRFQGEVSTFLKNDGLPDDQVFSVARRAGFGNSSMLFGTANGLGRINGSEVRAAALHAGAIEHGKWRCLLAARNGKIFSGGPDGLFEISLEVNGRAVVNRRAEGDILCMAERVSGEICCGSASGQLLSFDPKSGQLREEGHFPSAVKTVVEDKERNLWLGCEADGLYRLKSRELQLIPFPPATAGGNICCFQSPDRGLFLLSPDKDLFLCEDEQFNFQKHLPIGEDIAIRNAVMGSDGELWIGTQGDGLLVYRNGGISKFNMQNGLSDNSIESLCVESDAVWLGTRNGGLNRVDARGINRFNTPWGFSGQFATSLASDSDHALWIGTSGDGLFEMAQGRFTQFKEKDGLPNDQITALLADNEGSVWVGTSKGLGKVKNHHVTSFARPGGLLTDAVSRLAHDRDGNLWVGSDRGIFRIRKDGLDAFANGSASHVDTVQFGKEDGLPALQYLTDSAFPLDQSSAKLVWFVSNKGLVLTRPFIPLNTILPLISLDQVLLDNESVPVSDVIRVPPGKERIQFQFSALNLTAPGKVKYRYQLQPFDRDWSEPTTSRTALYSRLPAGKYRFRTIACNSDGIWDNEGVSVQLSVIPFWWETITFRVVVALVLVMMLFGWYSSRAARRKELEHLRGRIARDLHDEVGSSLWSITLLSRMLAKHGNLDAQEREDLGEIHRIASQTANSIRDIIWLINPAFNTVQDLLLRTQDFAHTILRGVEYKVVCDGADVTRTLSPELRQNLFLLFKEALANVARHSNASSVEVRVEEVGVGWRLTIQDNGAGFDPSTKTAGSGLANLQARAQKAGGKLEVRSQPTEGTALIFTIEKWK